jgi:hypothetical protein
METLWAVTEAIAARKASFVVSCMIADWGFDMICKGNDWVWNRLIERYILEFDQTTVGQQRLWDEELKEKICKELGGTYETARRLLTVLSLNNTENRAAELLDACSHFRDQSETGFGKGWYAVEKSTVDLWWSHEENGIH